ncbi:hypothetical protein Q9Q95_03005 [Sphingomonas sp. DG1-23]|uniref:hypothetical protein n=1 Tax=Sphingomonas sp. DG1-23 TaxID=3068316 RepID=UPI00273FF597|nr:hypothetical protein [Sphingomonas sp. DG1-23]MDP5277883.1 hypothetical protein [Sphingomonas sp. DG1-23]
MFVATALAALLLMLAVFTPPAGSLGLYVAVFVVTALVVAVLGMPLYLLALRLRWTNPWTALLAGTATGTALPLINAISGCSSRPWRYVAIYALVGAVGGLAFYLTVTATQTPRRNLGLLLALAGLTITAALLSPPPA